MYSFIFDEKTQGSVDNVYRLNYKLAFANDQHKFGTILVEAINKKIFWAEKNLSLELLPLMDVLKKEVSGLGKKTGSVFFNYNTEEWQKLN